MSAGRRTVVQVVESQHGIEWNTPSGLGRSTGRPRLEIRQIDDDPLLMEQSYRLRYQVYCLERNFLKASNYPDQLECDEFDGASLHAGVISGLGGLVGTVRFVKGSTSDLPLFRHCTISTECERELLGQGIQLAEVSRLCVSRACRDDLTGNNRVALSLFRAGYQTSKRNGVTHWLAAMEPSLHRLLSSIGVPFRIAGPVTDYFGPVAPYVCDLHEFDGIILSGTRPRLRPFLDGLEPQFHPAAVMGVA
jgi:N-acyl-L-homoserine lactone synthetase